MVVGSSSVVVNSLIVIIIHVVTTVKLLQSDLIDHSLLLSFVG